jgi:hypothetical protein
MNAGRGPRAGAFFGVIPAKWWLRGRPDGKKTVFFGKIAVFEEDSIDNTCCPFYSSH